MDESIIIALIGSSVIAAIIGVINNIVTFMMSRKAKKEDDNSQRNDRLTNLETKVEELEEVSKKSDQDLATSIEKLSLTTSKLQKGLMIILYDRIFYIANNHIKANEVSFHQKQNLHKMHDVYHKDLNGNGDLDGVMKDLDSIKVNYDE